MYTTILGYTKWILRLATYVILEILITVTLYAAIISFILWAGITHFLWSLISFKIVIFVIYMFVLYLVLHDRFNFLYRRGHERFYNTWRYNFYKSLYEWAPPMNKQKTDWGLIGYPYPDLETHIEDFLQGDLEEIKQLYKKQGLDIKIKIEIKKKEIK